MNIIINEDNLQIKDIEEINIKVRAMLTNDNNELLIANYGGIYLLPGGKVDDNENIIKALIRELNEETGIAYNNEELEYLCTLDYYQKNYPKRDNTVKNRLLKTYYYIGKIKHTQIHNQKLTEKELKGNFNLEYIPLNQIKQLIINNNTNNQRNIYFQKELLKIIKYYNNYIKNQK